MNRIDTPNQDHLRLSPTLSFCFLAISGKLFIGMALLVAAFWINFLCIPAMVIFGIAFYRFWYIRNVMYIITSETIKTRTGIFNYVVTTLELYRVKDYIVTQSLIMRIFKIMTLTLYTTDKQESILVMEGIPQSGLGDVIRDLVQRARSKSKIVEFN
mgnify:CR=1 FL=1